MPELGFQTIPNFTSTFWKHRHMIEKVAHESIYDALRGVVDALGGAKVIGHRMRPEKSIADARVWLLNCLNSDRSERFDPEQVILLLRWGNDAGAHSGMNYIAAETGYSASPIAPVDQVAEATKHAEAAARHAEQAFTKLRAQLDAAHVNTEGMA